MNWKRSARVIEGSEVSATHSKRPTQLPTMKKLGCAFSACLSGGPQYKIYSQIRKKRKKSRFQPADFNPLRIKFPECNE